MYLWLEITLEFYYRKTQDKIFATTPAVTELISCKLKLQVDDKILSSKNSFNFTQDPKITGIDRPENTIKR